MFRKAFNSRYLFLILIPHLISAALEGASFALILFAFSALGDMQRFYLLILGAIILQAFRSLVSYVGLYGTSLLSLKMQIELQKRVYQQILKFSYPFIAKCKVGDLSEYIKNPSTFVPAFFDALNRLLVSFFLIVGLVCVLCWISPILTLSTVGLLAVFAAAQKKIIQKVTQHSTQLTSHLFEFSHQTVQSLQGIKPIYTFQRQTYILKKIEHTLDLVAKWSKSAFLWNNSVQTINETVNVLLVGAILILGTFIFAQNGQSAMANLVTYIALTYRLTTRLQMCMSAASTIGLHYGSLLRLNEILDEKGKEFAPVLDKKMGNWDRLLEFREVSFAYPGANQSVLHRVSFSIEKGTTVAFVGLSGAGKSSTLDLILGLQKPSSGTILVDGEDLSLFSSESWLGKIGVVSQDPFVFNDTVEENIRFGDPHASGEDLQKACELAGVTEQGKTPIGERGYRLSGGERQRIALARALLRNPEILILDEATSHLDSHSEKQIQKSLERIKKGKTFIIVAHRLSSVVHADRIFVLENGEIVERGTHAELILKNGRYASLFSTSRDSDSSASGRARGPHLQSGAPSQLCASQLHTL